MTDTPPSDSASPFEHPPDPLPPADQSAGQGGVSSSLAELESKLRELESKLNLLGAESQRAVQPAMSAPALASAQPLASTEPQSFEAPVLDPLAEPAPALLVDEASAAVQPAVQKPRSQDAQEGRLVDEALPSDTQASAERSSPAVLAELLGFRERLERLTRELFEDYDQLLSRLTDQPSQAHVAAAPTREPAASAHELTQFEGHVELGIGPFFNDMQWLSDFERHLARIPNVAKTSIRRVEAGHAVLDLELSAPVTLLAELRTAVNGDFSVREISQNRLAITLEDS